MFFPCNIFVCYLVIKYMIFFVPVIYVCFLGQNTRVLVLSKTLECEVDSLFEKRDVQLFLDQTSNLSSYCH